MLAFFGIRIEGFFFPSLVVCSSTTSAVFLSFSAAFRLGTFTSATALGFTATTTALRLTLSFLSRTLRTGW